MDDSCKQVNVEIRVVLGEAYPIHWDHSGARMRNPPCRHMKHSRPSLRTKALCSQVLPRPMLAKELCSMVHKIWLRHLKWQQQDHGRATSPHHDQSRGLLPAISGKHAATRCAYCQSKLWMT